MGFKSKTPPSTGDRPAWTQFFDGDVYRRYQDYMRNKDFSQILSSRLSTQTNTSSLNEHSPKLHTTLGVPVTHSKTSDRPLKRDVVRRRKRTACLVCLLILLLVAIALAVGLVIHFVYIEDANDDRIASEVTIAIPGNKSQNQEIFIMDDAMEYVNDGPATITCNIYHAKNWIFFAIENKKNQTNAGVRVHSTGKVTWSEQSPRLEVHYQITPSTLEGESNLTISLTFSEVDCKDAGDYVCHLEKIDVSSPGTMAALRVRGRPSGQLRTIIPHDIEFKDRIHVTGIWSAGYPEAWSSLIWDVKAPGSPEFVRVEDNDVVQTKIVDEDTCEVIIKNVLEVSSNSALNGTQVRLSTKEEVIVVRNSAAYLVPATVDTIYVVAGTPVIAAV